MMSAFSNPLIDLITLIWAYKGRPVLSPVGKTTSEFSPSCYKKTVWDPTKGNLFNLDSREGQYLGSLPFPYAPSKSGKLCLFSSTTS